MDSRFHGNDNRQVIYAKINKRHFGIIDIETPLLSVTDIYEIVVVDYSLFSFV